MPAAVLLLSSLTACFAEDREPSNALAQEASWSAEAPDTLASACFGHSVALGDVSGDGRPDLVVSAPPCTTQPGGHVALYLGTAGPTPFAATPVVAALDWQAPNPNASARATVVSVGDVDGDRFADVLVRAAGSGTLVFAGRADAEHLFDAPLFRAPSLGTHPAAFLSDLDADGRDELVVAQGFFRVQVYRATPGAAEPFALVREVDGGRPVDVGDLDGDGARDVLLHAAEGSALFRGCGPQASACEGGLTTGPAWSASADVLALVADQDGDGHPDAFVQSRGRTRLQRALPGGGLDPTPLWSVDADLAFPGLSGTPIPAGDLNGDDRATDFLLTAAGRLYAFFPAAGVSQALRPAYAWPRGDALTPDGAGYARYAPVSAGDLDADGDDDLVVGVSPMTETLAPTRMQQRGRVLVLGGGSVPKGDAPPRLAPSATCGLRPAEGALPDVTVDRDVLARTVLLDQERFEPNACEVTEACVGAPGDRRLLRFSVAIPNKGSGSVRIPLPEERPELYQYDSCHKHDHLVGFARYELLDARGESVAIGRKQGFFLVDVAPVCGDAGPPTEQFDAQYIASGWGDVYTADYPCQWLDVTDLPNGRYRLRITVDAADLIPETDALSNSVELGVELSGTEARVLP